MFINWVGFFFILMKKTGSLDVLDVIKSRRSVRHFLARKVDDSIILDALEAALWAPSAGNVQDKMFIIIRDVKAKVELISACYEQVWVAKAPVIIVLVSDVTKMNLKFQERGEFYSVLGAGAALESMLLFLSSKGLQATHVGLFDEVKLKRLLKVPDDKRIFSVVALGYPAELPPVPVRAELKNVTFLEFYDNKWVKDKPRTTYLQ